MTPRWRRSLIAMGAIATGAAYYFGPGERKAPDAAAIAAPRETTTLGELPRRGALGRQRGDLFAPHSWAPPAPPPPPQEQQEAAPLSPPNPYRFAGTVQYEGVRKVLLTRGGDRVFEVQAGEVLEPGFRVQAVTADAVTLFYEPMNAAVTVALVFPEALPSAAAGSGR